MYDMMLTLCEAETTPTTRHLGVHPLAGIPISHVSKVLVSDLNVIPLLYRLLIHPQVILETGDSVELKM